MHDDTAPRHVTVVAVLPHDDFDDPWQAVHEIERAVGPVMEMTHVERQEGEVSFSHEIRSFESSREDAAEVAALIQAVCADHGARVTPAISALE